MLHASNATVSIYCRYCRSNHERSEHARRCRATHVRPQWQFVRVLPYPHTPWDTRDHDEDTSGLVLPGPTGVGGRVPPLEVDERPAVGKWCGPSGQERPIPQQTSANGHARVWSNAVDRRVGVGPCARSDGQSGDNNDNRLLNIGARGEEIPSCNTHSHRQVGLMFKLN